MKSESRIYNAVHGVFDMTYYDFGSDKYCRLVGVVKEFAASDFENKRVMFLVQKRDGDAARTECNMEDPGISTSCTVFAQFVEGHHGKEVEDRDLLDTDDREDIARILFRKGHFGELTSEECRIGYAEAVRLMLQFGFRSSIQVPAQKVCCFLGFTIILEPPFGTEQFCEVVSGPGLSFIILDALRRIEVSAGELILDRVSYGAVTVRDSIVILSSEVIVGGRHRDPAEWHRY